MIILVTKTQQQDRGEKGGGVHFQLLSSPGKIHWLKAWGRGRQLPHTLLQKVVRLSRAKP